MLILLKGFITLTTVSSNSSESSQGAFEKSRVLTVALSGLTQGLAIIYCLLEFPLQF